MSLFLIRRSIVVARPQFLISTLCHPPAVAATSRSSTPPSRQLSCPDDDPDHQLEAGRFLRRFLFFPQRCHLFQYHSSPSASSAEGCLGRPFPVREKLLDRIQVINGERALRLEGLVPPPQVARNNITAEDARRVIRAAQVRAARERVMAVQRSCVSYPEFVDIVRGSNSSVEWLKTTEKDAIELSKSLESSGVVLKIGNLVFLHPDHVRTWYQYIYIYTHTLLASYLVSHNLLH